MTKSSASAYWQGRNAHGRGVPYERNPYPRGDIRRAQWAKGHSMAARSPEIHIDINSHNAKRSAKAKTNPRSRSKKPVGRVSQATGKKPTKRLVARRKATLIAPKGFYANPAPKKYFIVEQEQNGLWYQVANFYLKTSAFDYAKWIAGKSGKPVRVIRGYPGPVSKAV